MSSTLLAACTAIRILLLTDSHGVLGEFGPTLQTWLQQQPGARVDTYAIGASAPNWFFVGALSKCAFEDHACGPAVPKTRGCSELHAPILSAVLPKPEAIKRQVVVVELGTNQIPGTDDDILKQTSRMARAIAASGSQCLWIGPPRMRRYTDAQVDRLYSLYERALAESGCQLIDSRPLATYPDGIGDGIHYWFPNTSPADRARGDAQARAWADGTIAVLRERLEKP